MNTWIPVPMVFLLGIRSCDVQKQVSHRGLRRQLERRLQ
jgi:hypothetical protein